MENNREDSSVSKENEAPDAETAEEDKEEKFVYNPAYSNSIFEFIIQYKDTKIFQWVHNHTVISILFLVVMGIAILVVFFIFMYRIMAMI